jgi:Flp pilus assembly CpaE family ATPase
VNVLLIEDNPGDARLVEEMLSEESGGSFSIQWAQALLPGLAQLAAGGIDVVLLDLSLPDSQGLESLGIIHTHAPNVPVVVLTGLDNHDIAQQAVRSGAQDYLVKGELNASRLGRTLHYAVLRHQSLAGAAREESTAGLGKAIGFLGARGGVGTTSIACHVSLDLKRQTRERVLLSDLDVAGGSIGFLTKAASQHSIHEAADNLLRLDENYWSKIAVSGVDGLEILPSRGPLDLEEQAATERIRHVLRFTRSIYRWVVIDLGRLNPFAEGLFSELSDLFLIVTIDVLVLSEAKRIVRSLKDAGMDQRLLHLVVNQTPRHPDILPQEVGDMVGVPVYAVLPEGSAEMSEAYTSGRLLNEKSKLRGHIARLAAKIAGLEQKDRVGVLRASETLTGQATAGTVGASHLLARRGYPATRSV